MENKTAWEEWSKYPIHDVGVSDIASELVAKYEETYSEGDRRIAQDYIEENGRFIHMHYLAIMSALLKNNKGGNMLNHLVYVNGGNIGEFNFEIPKDGK